MTQLPATTQPESVSAIIDSREQLPMNLDPLRVETGALDTGDYSLAGCEHVVRIERKSLNDLLGCVGSQRERLEREVTSLEGKRRSDSEDTAGGRYCSQSRVETETSHAHTRARLPVDYPFRPSSNVVAAADRSSTTRTTACRIQPSTVRRRPA